MYSNTGGHENEAVGWRALTNNTTGHDNAGFGYYCLSSNQTGNYNTALGNNSNTVGVSYSNTTGIGFGANPTASNTIYIGNTSVTSIKGQVGFTTYSDARFKKNIRLDEVKGVDIITKLTPVTYNYDIKSYAKWIEANYGEIDTSNWAEKYDIEKIRFSGFLAQDVEHVANEVGYNFSGVDKPKNDKDIYGLRYGEFVVPLVKAVQEQQAIIEQMKQQIQEQQKEIEDLKEKVGE